MEMALERLRLLHDAGGDVLCTALDGSDDRDAVAGRAMSPGTPVLTEAGWAALVDLLHAIADEASALGHATVFHPHAATYVETPIEVDRLMLSTDPARIGICLDTGHHIVGGGDPVATIRDVGERVRHVHLKDVDPDVLEGLRAGDHRRSDDAIYDGLFTELGAGTLDLDGVLRAADRDRVRRLADGRAGLLLRPAIGERRDRATRLGGRAPAARPDHCPWSAGMRVALLGAGRIGRLQISRP